MDSAEPIVLTYEPEEPPAVIPDEEPPEYISARKPTVDVRYSFSPLGSNAMILLPPATSPDTRPLYYMTVAANIFMPLSFITTVYRGANEYGDRIAEFEMGISSIPARLKIKDKANLLTKYLAKTQGGTRKQWTWISPFSESTARLTWAFAASQATCSVRSISHNAVKEDVLARCNFPTATVICPYTVLVTPAGQEYFDDIVLSFLINERKRLTLHTTSSDIKELWNF